MKQLTFKALSSFLLIGSTICSPIIETRFAISGNEIAIDKYDGAFDNTGKENILIRPRISIGGDVHSSGSVISVDGNGHITDNSGNDNTITLNGDPRIAPRIHIGGNANTNGSLISVGGNGQIMDNSGNGNTVISPKPGDIIVIPRPSGNVHNGDINIGSSFGGGKGGDASAAGSICC